MESDVASSPLLLNVSNRNGRQLYFVLIDCFLFSFFFFFFFFSLSLSLSRSLSLLFVAVVCSQVETVEESCDRIISWFRPINRRIQTAADVINE